MSVLVGFEEDDDVSNILYIELYFVEDKLLEFALEEILFEIVVAKILFTLVGLV